MKLDDIKTSCVFRYRDVNKNTAREIINKKIWHSNVSGLNDPFEFPITVSWEDFDSTEVKTIIAYNNCFEFLTHDQLLEIYMKFGLEKLSNVILENLERIPNALYDHYSSLLVCCFSKRPDSPLMWSHYANGMKGICIAYDRNILESSEGFTLQDVIYNKTPFKFDYSDLKFIPAKGSYSGYDLKNSEYQIFSAKLVRLKSYSYLFQKHERWEYEEELRTIFNPGEACHGTLLPIPDNSVRAIIVGEKISPAYFSLIKKYCQKYDKFLFISKANKENYMVEISPVKL